MTDIPQLGPEVFVDDEDDIAKKQATTFTNPLLSPQDIQPQSPFLIHGLDGVRRQRATDAASNASSPGVSPRLSPHRPTNSAFSFDGDIPSPSGSAASSRRGSAVAENVLEVLDNSAWGESIRRSFTVRRPNNRGSS
jgi:voltage-dependent calcium channel